jgi:hypothetical protein
VEIQIGQGVAARRVFIPLEPILTADEHRESAKAPFSFARLADSIEWDSNDFLQKSKLGDLRWLWLYRDAFFVTQRVPQPSEIDEVVLRIKALHYQRDEETKTASRSCWSGPETKPLA